MVWSRLALAPGLGPSIRLCKATSHPSSLYFLTFFNESPANARGFSTGKDYSPHQPTITPTHSHHRSTGGGTDHDHGRGGGGVCDAVAYYVYA